MKLFCFILLFSLFLLGCNPVYHVYIGENETAVEVDIADTKYKQAKGLMFRTNLDENEGMIFVFEEEEDRRFWMMNTLIPLDMIFIKEDGTINNIEQAVPCETEECEVYPGYGKYVLEVNQGFCEENDIEVGDFVDVGEMG